ncbi:hypothetical protein HO100_11350 [Corynebacterium ulcerans]|uniref:Major capsid protein n=1 Tax=Corynebacterium ulcerans FRC58 TaxID=1408268 RepID=A0ABM5U2Y9_CORUL|nr:hypothetical protein [Corynebacterium ulcerans]AKN77527.1 Hypothetical protein CulFRC58_1673 [Corynebacterium ulcerans FRC58]NOL63356.1 hypothetical protein [Corynebacterium ulcerans]NON15682.1 hypothetical protein [Corynebacterium ulcerans]
MAQHLTSAYGGDTLTVDSIIKDPTWLQERTLENLDGTDLVKAIFRNGGTNDGVVAYREAAAPFLNDDAEVVPEFSEIPVADLNQGRVKKLVSEKTGVAVRISREMIKKNKIDQVSLRQTALQNTMVKNGVEAAVKAFRAAPIQTLGVSANWGDTDASPMFDIRQAKRKVSKAKAPNQPNALMGYRADTILCSPASTDLMLFHEEVQRFYRGNAAVENPIFKGITPQTIAGLRVIESAWMPDDEIYVLQAGVAGFESVTDPLTVTPLYSEHGENGYGGANQSWRMDAFRERILAVDNPLAVVKITGFEA